MKRMACVLALAAGTGLVYGPAAPPALASPAPASPASGLQVDIVAPGTITGDTTINLDVKFHGGNLRSIELYVDGKRVNKEPLRTKKGRGIIHFSLDPELLIDGDHDLLIKAFDSEGNIATASARISVVPGDMNSPVRYQYPKNNAMVQGTVPLEAKLDGSLKKPFVMFFLDNEFLALINYAPYTYNWDSTRVGNGTHVLGIEAYDGDTVAKVVGTKVNITVNNPGGFTNRQNDTPKLGGGTPVPLVGPSLPPAVSGTPGTQIGLHGFASDLIISHVAPQGVFGMRNSGRPTDSLSTHFQPGTGGTPHPFVAPAVKPRIAPDLSSVVGASPNLNPLHPGTSDATAQPDLTLHPVKPGVGVPTLDIHSASPVTNTGTNSITKPERSDRSPLPRASARIVKPGMLALLATPKDLQALRLVPMEGVIVHQSVRPLRAGNIAARPSSVLIAPPPAVPNGHSKAELPTDKAPATSKSLVGGGSLVNGGSFDVAFDNTRIAFDVRPRVEKGLPLAPFRQIFEHTGGSIKWFSQSKTVRAINSTREIEIKIGQKQAKVNNQPILMEAKPYIDRGRTIVPLSFIRDALDVTIQFDPATGHLMIESKK